ncbi:MAG: YfiR family protein [Chromatiaceae bacterium]|nr:YfiR family protein [Chromatiaceae bacterium]MCF7995607.1 YfiR family protein [Chromatiaceae bacterium]MCF8015637.1 YfiR family protein [Chromatiaceae bacterium]
MTRSIQHAGCGRQFGALSCLLLLWLSSAWALPLWQEELQRLRVGLNLFPAVLGAQEQLSAQRNADGVLEIVIVYRSTDKAAQQAVASLEALGQVQGHPLRVSVVPIEQLEPNREPPLAAIFVASSGLEPDLLRRLSERHQVLVFSPFEGDVSAGAVAGIHVADRILPSINLAQARRAGLSFKPFFLRVAHHAE